MESDEGGLLRVTRAVANEPGLSLCVTSDSGHSKFQVLREPGLSDGPWRQSVILAAASDGGPLRVFLERKLCEIRAQATKDLGCCMALPVREAA